MPALTARPRDARVPATDGAALIAAFMLASAGLAHLAVTPAHFAEWWVSGALFALSAALQIALAVGIFARPSRTLALGAVTVSAGLLLTWLVSRTGGLPFGPDAGQAERVGLLDALTTFDELALIGLLALTARELRGGAARRLLQACEASGVAVGTALVLAFAGGIGHA